MKNTSISFNPTFDQQGPVDNLIIFSKSEQDSLYEMAVVEYGKGRYAEAQLVFRQLVIANAEEQRFWRGLAGSLQLLNKYEEALYAWSVVALLEIDDPAPHFHAAECYYFLDDRENAKKALNFAEKRATVDGPICELINQLKMYYDRSH